MTGCQVMQINQQVQIMMTSSFLPWQFSKEGENVILQTFKHLYSTNSKINSVLESSVTISTCRNGAAAFECFL